MRVCIGKVKFHGSHPLVQEASIFSFQASTLDLRYTRTHYLSQPIHSLEEEWHHCQRRKLLHIAFFIIKNYDNPHECLSVTTLIPLSGRTRNFTFPVNKK